MIEVVVVDEKERWRDNGRPSKGGVKRRCEMKRDGAEGKDEAVVVECGGCGGEIERSERDLFGDEKIVVLR